MKERKKVSSQKCTICKKIFERNDSDEIANRGYALGRKQDEPLCYNCALKKVTGDMCPEEGDFNSAHLISGQITDQEWKWMQEDFRAVEEGRSIIESNDSDDDDYYYDPAWCYQCHRDIAFCKCICHECGERLESCECLCALCKTPTPGGGLCKTHAPEWHESVQGPVPDSSDQVGKCESCGIAFNAVYEIGLELQTLPGKEIRILTRHNRKKCLRCS